jgi:hypothetical protein
MYVCLNSLGHAVAWNYDGTMPNDVPAGATVVDVPEAQFLQLRTMRGRVRYSGTRFVPLTASAGDFMRALIELDWYSSVNAAVAALNPSTANGKLAQVQWSRAAIFKREHPLLLQIAAAIGKTSEDLDDLFLLANTYDA